MLKVIGAVVTPQKANCFGFKACNSSVLAQSHCCQHHFPGTEKKGMLNSCHLSYCYYQ